MNIKRFNTFKNTFKLVTSNKQKLKEYKKYIPEIESTLGSDLPEVLADDITVILYKSLHNGPNTLCEDTSLNIEDFDIGVNIRWFIDKINLCIGKKAEWKVLIGKNDGEYITIYEGIVKGVINNNNIDGTAFDPYFYIDNKSLAELKNDVKIDPTYYSARAKACINLLNNNIIKKIKISTIPEWTGKYQH
jgi:inosine/xanthosine triphosphate pyrophosphatase family protein